jgi:two-component sensor histidine kinase
MSRTRSASDVLERDFLDTRSRILDLAAALDRLDRSADRPEIEADPRLERLQTALELLRKPGPGRAEAVQLLFSDPYEDGWRAKLPASSRLD